MFDVEQKNRLSQSGLLKRFSIQCYGKQSTVEELRADKMQKFEELKNNRNSEEYEMWFLAYNPGATQKKKGEIQIAENKDKDEKKTNARPPPIKKTARKYNAKNNIQRWKYKRQGFLY